MYISISVGCVCAGLFMYTHVYISICVCVCLCVHAFPPASALFGLREAVVEAATVGQKFQVQRACVAPL